ncbi:TauD/TfdA family dioxygenase [Streptomyces benahoarensis]|uniref:TauD/TfdA family dioxygenase n=1 Tax=Streptomyces benahoarensis TaxID=2595054 RepID=UPI002035F68B|nr:TauD/TfdA family dioxygenase [Streptomyces benahoarensis]
MGILAHDGEDTFINLPNEPEKALIDLGSTLPSWDLEGTFLADSAIERYQAELASVPLVTETIESLLAMLSTTGTGYAVVRLGKIAEVLGTGKQFLRLATAILAEVARPFQPFRRWPLWKESGTNLNANPGLSTGTGYNAFHMDLVNATRPPDYTTLLCVRTDPLGAGASIVSNAREAVSHLTPSSRALLTDVAYAYGGLYSWPTSARSTSRSRYWTANPTTAGLCGSPPRCSPNPNSMRYTPTRPRS